VKISDTNGFKCLYAGTPPYIATLEDCAYWETLNPTREQGYRLIELLEADRKRDLREAMREAVKV
jgi:hypothetical protein